jgi:protein gp37
MDQSKISWLDGGNTFNPWVGCNKVSPGCINCYAEKASLKLRVSLDLPPLWGKTAHRHVTSDANWDKPLAWWRKARRTKTQTLVFCASMSDVFEDHPVPAAQRPKLFELIDQTRCKAAEEPGLHWLLLTKRPENVVASLPEAWGDGWFGVWIGTSIESASQVSRAEVLRSIPASVRFISYEPALSQLPDDFDLKGIHWLIAGGESGPGYRPDNPDWYRHARDMCRRASVPFFFKQSASGKSGRGDILDGSTWREWPECYSRVSVPPPTQPSQ